LWKTESRSVTSKTQCPSFERKASEQCFSKRERFKSATAQQQSRTLAIQIFMPLPDLLNPKLWLWPQKPAFKQGFQLIGICAKV
jgi:hypothetical protein